MRLLYVLLFLQLSLIVVAIPSDRANLFNGKKTTEPEPLKKNEQPYPKAKVQKSEDHKNAGTPSADAKSAGEITEQPVRSPQPTDTDQKERKLLSSQTDEGGIIFSDDVRQCILNEHNMYRRRIAKGEVPHMPAATIMNELMWSDKIAEKAREWANKCEMAHTPQGYYCGLDGYDNIGENLATRTTSADGLNSDEKLKDAFKWALNSWFDEYKNYKFITRTCSKVCGHFTQMVRDSTEKVGCGIAMCSGGVKGFRPGIPSYLIVCNYGPGNNFANQPPYETDASKACPQVRPTRKDYLCTGNGKKGPEKCEDKTNFCSTWKEQGKCKMCNNPYYQWMIGVCPKTCGIC
uniref:ShKT domain-containing protein n=1 Tax=Trichuris muris TaxID=70415 RepID=A0A5S6QHZ4_TRIMR